MMEPKLVSKFPNSGDALEVSVHTLPKPLLREFHHVFAEKYLDPNHATTASQQQQNHGAAPGSQAPVELLAIPTNQRARMDLVQIGDHVEDEKDRLLNTVRGHASLSSIYGRFILGQKETKMNLHNYMHAWFPAVLFAVLIAFCES